MRKTRLLGGALSLLLLSLGANAMQHNYKFHYYIHYKCYENVIGYGSSYGYFPPDGLPILQNNGTSERNLYDKCDREPIEEIEITTDMTNYHGDKPEDIGLKINEVRVSRCDDGTSRTYQQCQSLSVQRYQADFEQMEIGVPKRIKLSDDLTIEALIDSFPSSRLKEDRASE